MPKAGEEKSMETTINGYVEEVELEDGNSGVLINDGDEDFYVVMDKIGKRLLDHVDEEVEVTGRVSKKKGELVIKVIQFNLLDEEGDFDDDDMDQRWDA